MYLKKLVIQGFKSFADKVSVDFESGITAVVGPNGSGKSNISDSIRWVLGEQSAKTLRGSKMEDIIFAGTQNRKALSFAEVTLVFDNSLKKLPLEYSEVSISRRIYRSGESEFYINKVSCRLKDIRELFMDTGVGQDGYSVIGQGKIDEILSSKSEDRRNIFEEAAGITKYKSRKVESEKKLEATKQNLLRIDDIISELEIQINPLKEQSAKAQKYLELSEKLRVLDINLFIDNYDKLNEGINSIKCEQTEVEDIFNKCTLNLENADGMYVKLSEQNKQIENDILDMNQEIFEIEKHIEKLYSETEIINEKIANNHSNKDRLLDEINSLNEKINLFNSDLKVRQDKLNQLDESVKESNEIIASKQTQIDNVNQALASSFSQIEDLKSEIIENHNLISTKKGSINSINVLIDNIEKRKKQITDEVEQLQESRTTKSNELKFVQDQIDKVNLLIVELNTQIESFFKGKEDLNKKLNDNVGLINKTKETLNTKASRHSLLCDMNKEYEGFNKSVKTILKECDKSPNLSKGIHGALVQLISVPKEYEVAIEIALGGALQNIVTDDEKSAQKIIEFLKSNNFGRATFLPMTSVKARYFNGLEKELSKLKGVVGVGSDLIKYDQKYSGIIGNLLGKVLIVDNMSNAVELAKIYNYSFKIVTLEGEVLAHGGSISGGSVNKTTNLIGRSREIEELANDIANLKVQLDSLNAQNGQINSDTVKLNEDLDKTNDDKRNSELSLNTYMVEKKQYEQLLEGLNDRLNVMKLEESQLSEQRENASNQILTLEKEVKGLSQSIENMTQKTSLNQKDYNSKVQVRDQLNEELTSEKIKTSGINQEIISTKENVERIENEINQVNYSINYNLKVIETIEADISNHCGDIDGKNKELEIVKIKKDQKVAELSKMVNDKKEIELQVDNHQRAWKELNNELNTISDKKSKLQVKMSKYEMELEVLQNRIWEEYQMTYSKCLELKQDISGYMNPNKEIKDLKSQINALGNVNIDSIEEYVKVKERYEFLSEQKNDLDEAEKGLRKVINDMVKIMKTQFIEQFEIINNNFNDVFKELFGGGRAHLKLMDEENILECGIEIEAQPPGKKLQNLSLLSGGERALTGIAILFAMLKVRPTPFCVLDEIEAALDDVNVFRYAEYLKRFTEDTQFLVITHRKGTMEAADSIYGVTMQDQGVSKLVSIKLSDEIAS